MNEIVSINEEIDEELEMRQFSTQTHGFEFWIDEREDIYQD